MVVAVLLVITMEAVIKLETVIVRAAFFAMAVIMTR
jgi:hypothetical protein